MDTDPVLEYILKEGKIIKYKNKEGYYTRGDLFLGSYSESLKSLPDNLTVKGWLDLTNCTSLTRLPDKAPRQLECKRVLESKGMYPLPF